MIDTSAIRDQITLSMMESASKSPCDCSNHRNVHCETYTRCNRWYNWFRTNWQLITRYLKEHNLPVTRKVMAVRELTEEEKVRKSYYWQLYKWGTWKHDGT